MLYLTLVQKLALDIRGDDDSSAFFLCANSRDIVEVGHLPVCGLLRSVQK